VFAHRLFDRDCRILSVIILYTILNSELGCHVLSQAIYWYILGLNSWPFGLDLGRRGAGQIGGIDQFLRNFTDVLHQIEDNVRPPFPTTWFQATLVLALVWMLTLSLGNLWDAIIRGSKHVTSLPEAKRTCSWIHPVLQGLNKFIHLF